MNPGSSYTIPFYLKTNSENTFDLQVSPISGDSIFEVNEIASALDAIYPAPGIPLGFGRVFSQGSMYSGALGYGWIHDYDMRLEKLSDGTVALIKGNSYSSFFRSNGGRNYTAIGDHSTLTSNPGGNFTLKEKDGTIYGFRTDLRFDFVEDTNGNRISAIYGSDNKLIKLLHSDGDYFNFEYNEHGRISRLIDHKGRVTQYQYDTAGKLLLNATTPDGSKTNYNYTSGGSSPIIRKIMPANTDEVIYELASISYPDGRQQFFKSDGNKRLSESYLDGKKEIIQYSYDVDNKTTYITDAGGNKASVNVDEFGQIKSSKNPLGAVSRFEYDANFNLIRQTDPLSNTYNFSYDERGNIVKVRNPLNNEITMEYNKSFNKLTKLKDGRGNEVAINYDMKGNPLNMIYPDSSKESFKYDPAGNPIAVTTRKGSMINYTYNNKGQVTRKDYPDGSWAAYSYDDAGNMISAADNNGTIAMEYNAMNLLTRITYPTGYFFNYSYDAGGRIIKRIDKDGNALNYEYDSAGRLVRMSNESNSEIVRYEYNAIERLSKKTVGSGAYTTYEYDAAGQILHLINYNGSGSILSRFDYTYDLAGNPISMNTLEGIYSYQYDKIGQLTKVTDPDGRYESYSYDAAGNRNLVDNNGITTTYTTNNMNQYTNVGNVSYSYDANGNMISKTENGSTTTYLYNLENRLIKVTSPEGTWEYRYDVLGNRVSVVHNGTERRYLVEPVGFGNVVAEYDGNRSLIARYVHGLGLISKADKDENQYYYHFNPTGHTTEITNKEGDVVNHYKYSPFGEYIEKEETIPNPFGYVGEFGVMDDDNGLNYMRMRYYQPEIGRFSSVDKVWVPGENQFVYAENSPINLFDPLGLESSLPNIGELEKAPNIGKLVENIRQFYEFIHDLQESKKGKIAWFYYDEDLKSEKWGELRYKWVSKEMQELLENERMGFEKYGRDYWKYDTGTWWDSEGKLHYEFDIDMKIQSVNTIDPEDKYGPTGFDHPDTPPAERKRFIPANQEFYYRVDFWNKENATAPACDVYVKDQLDPKLNWSTFRFKEIGFLNWSVDLDTGQYFNIYVDTRPEMNLTVNVEGTFDRGTGGLNWTFSCLDPATLKTPDDPLAGFLLPLKNGYEIGWVGFSIEPEKGLTTGTQVKNQAFVNFDGLGPFNPAPKEAPFVNTIDAIPPVSNMTASQLERNTIQLNWTGEDDLNGSGIRDYSIYVSKNGGIYEPFLVHTTNTSAIFKDESGRTYAFYSIARDNAGNIEDKPEKPDALFGSNTTSPASITNLHNTTFAQTYITWTWADPSDSDFSKVMIFLDGSFSTNVSKGVQYYNATGLTSGTTHTISTRTVGTSGSINLTWVNHTATTNSSGEIKGDVNRNGRRDTGDATLILRSIVGLPIPSQYLPILPTGDMNCNNRIDTGDATLVLRDVVGLSIPRCWG